jgi:hypothetical protein
MTLVKLCNAPRHDSIGTKGGCPQACIVNAFAKIHIVAQVIEVGVTIEDFFLMMMMSMFSIISAFAVVSMEKLGGSLMFLVLITVFSCFHISTSDFNFRFTPLAF